MKNKSINTLPWYKRDAFNVSEIESETLMDLLKQDTNLFAIASGKKFFIVID